MRRLVRDAVAKHRKEVAAVEERLQHSERALSEAREAVERRLARAHAVEAKREAARARRQATAPEVSAASPNRGVVEAPLV